MALESYWPCPVGIDFYYKHIKIKGNLSSEASRAGA
jgi:hypothetical protein